MNALSYGWCWVGYRIKESLNLKTWGIWATYKFENSSQADQMQFLNKYCFL
jgi:hypothetical protein